MKGMTGVHVVVGAGPPLGAAVVHRLHVSGEQIRAVVLDRNHMSSPFDSSVEVVVGDPMDVLSVEKFCSGATVVYNCFEPLYSRRGELSSRVCSNLLLASINERAVLAIASRLLNSTEDNLTMEDDAMEASGSKVAKVVIAQIPQIYGPGTVPESMSNVFDDVIRGKKAHWIGPLEVQRSMVYSLDAADALVTLANNEFSQGRKWTVAGPGPLTGKDIIEMSFRAVERAPQIRSGILSFAGRVPISRQKSPFDYETDFVLDGGDFSLAFPAFAYTPHETAIATTFEWYRDRAELGQNRQAQ
jgi:nucleoside-diphosphate-sugar epimerase